MGGMGGAQPLAATMTGAAFLGIDVDPERIKKRLKTGYCDFLVNTLDEALRILKNAVRKKENVSVGLVGNCADVIPELAERGVVPDILTDQTSAHDPLNGYIPNGMMFEEAARTSYAGSAGLSGTVARRQWHGTSKACCAYKKWARSHLTTETTSERLPSARGEKRIRLPRICARIYSSAILRRARAVPVGGAFWRGFGHCCHRRSRVGTFS